MPDARYPRKVSPDSSLADYSRSPSPAYPRSRSRSRPGRRSSYSRSTSQPRRASRRDSVSSSRSSSRSPSRGGKSRRTKLKEDFKDKTTTTSGMKTSLVFLGSVAAATYAAHKFWPKGVTYGEKEEWEIEKAAKKEKAKKEREWENPGRGGVPSRHGDDRFGVDDRRRDRDYDRPRSSHGRLGIEDVPRLHEGPAPDVDKIFLASRPVSTNRPQADGQTSLSVASGSRTGDARRAQYVEDNRTAVPERTSYVQVRGRQDIDYRAAPSYVQYEPRRSSYDEPPDVRRGERIVYARRDDGYR